MTAMKTKQRKKRRGYSEGEIPRSVRWRGSNFDYAKKLAAREDRSLNRWLNMVVERLWFEARKKDTMA